MPTLRAKTSVADDRNRAAAGVPAAHAPEALTAARWPAKVALFRPASTMAIGPFAFSGGVLALLAGVLAALAAAGFLKRRGEPDAGNVLFLILLAALLLARVAFVAGWWPQYRPDPLKVLDIRDHGFDPLAGLVGLALGAALMLWRRPALRRALAASLALGLLGWGFATLTVATLTGATRQQLPALALRDLGGREVALQDYRGQAVALNLWATWCGPCRREMPVLEAAQREHPDLRIVFVDQGESAAEVSAFLAAQKLALDHVLIDGQLDVSAAFNVRGYPTTLFFDADGRLRDTAMGELSAATLAAHLRRATAGIDTSANK